MNNVQFRFAEEEDAQAIIDHMRYVFAENPSYFGTSVDEFKVTVEEERQWISQHRDDGFLMVAEVAGEIAGLINFLPSKSKRFAHQGTLGIGVKEKYAGQGVGSELIRRLLQWAQSEPAIKKVSLEVFSNNERGLHLYKKMGFQEEGRLVWNAKLDDGTYVDDIILSQFV